MTRRWRAEPPAAEAPEWIDLIDRCPWDAAPAVADDGGGADDADAAGSTRRGAGADRFMWWIEARCGEDRDRQTELPDDEVVGAWRELVDAVRAWSRGESG
jgi:hypothetical protein